MTVEDLLASDLIRHRHSTFPLTEDGADDATPAGLVTFAQIRRVPPAERATTRLRDIAWPIDQVARAGPDEPAAELLQRLTGCAEGRALVIAGDRLVGIVSPSDVNRALRWLAVRGATPGR
jgi:CBS domain-containing protein